MESRLREPINGLTHCIGAGLSGIGLISLLAVAITQGTIRHIVSVLIFGLSLIGLYTASTVYHWVNVSDKVTAILKKIDHCMIFVLISGTYTPICMIALPKNVGIAVLATVWGITLLGIIFKLVWINAPRWLYTMLYVVMGWACLIVGPSMVATIPKAGMFWLVAGGVTYTLGAVIYATKKPVLKFKHFSYHEIFHLFAMGGSICHFICIMGYIVK